MNLDKSKIYLIEDDLSLATVYQEYLRREPHDIIHFPTAQEALDELRHKKPDVAILDLHLPDISGFEVLQRIQEWHPECPVIVITANGSIETAVKAMQAGAADFVVKPFNANRLIFTLRHVLERKQLVQIVETFSKDNNQGSFCGFIGNSLPMQEVYYLIKQAAKSKATIFISGESGTGKEVSAEAIHQLSPRAKKPFVALNCGAIPKDLIESEIFGHAKGSFTGAINDREGAAGQADGGTLFLDEICEMDLDLQVKLLRFVQTDSFRKVGGTKTEHVDVRIVCATNRNPWEEVQVGRFREDLFYRLHVIPLHMPPLDSREDDILEIASFYLEKYSVEEDKNFVGFSEEAQRSLITKKWPGNVRELQNVIRNVVVLHDGTIVSDEMLGLGSHTKPIAIVSSLRQMHETMKSADNLYSNQKISNQKASEHDSNDDIALKPLWKAERDLIQSALDHCNGNVQKAAAILEISPSTLYRRMRDLKDGICA